MRAQEAHFTECAWVWDWTHNTKNVWEQAPADTELLLPVCNYVYTSENLSVVTILMAVPSIWAELKTDD